MKRCVCREAKIRKTKGAMLFEGWDICDRNKIYILEIHEEEINCKIK